MTAGFLAGNAVSLVYLVIRQKLLEPLWFDPLTLFGGFLAVGLTGMLLGAVSGLTVRVLAERVAGSAAGWWGPVLASAVASGTIGLVIVRTVVSALTG